MPITEKDFKDEALILKNRHALLMQFVEGGLAGGYTPEEALNAADKAVLLCADWVEKRMDDIQKRYNDWKATQIEAAPETKQIPENASPADG